MFNKTLKVWREYRQVKEEAVEKTVNVLESKFNPLFIILFFILTLYQWIYAIFVIEGMDILYNLYGFYPLSIFLFISYFTVFLVSKLIIKPTQEELLDDTSTFALFSACDRKVNRSFISIGISLLHTLIFTLYLINKDLSLI